MSAMRPSSPPAGAAAGASHSSSRYQELLAAYEKDAEEAAGGAPFHLRQHIQSSGGSAADFAAATYADPYASNGGYASPDPHRFGGSGGRRPSPTMDTYHHHQQQQRRGSANSGGGLPPTSPQRSGRSGTPVFGGQRTGSARRGGSAHSAHSAQPAVGVRPAVPAAAREVERRFGGGEGARARATGWALAAAAHEVACHQLHKARSVYERHAVGIGSGGGAAPDVTVLEEFGGGGGSFSNNGRRSPARTVSSIASGRYQHQQPFVIDSSSLASMSAAAIGAAQEAKNATRRMAHRVDVIGAMPERLREQRLRAQSLSIAGGGAGGGLSSGPPSSFSSSAAMGGGIGRAGSAERGGGRSPKPHASSSAEFKWARGKAFTMAPLRPMRDGRFETPGPGAYVLPSEFQARR